MDAAIWGLVMSVVATMLARKLGLDGRRGGGQIVAGAMLFVTAIALPGLAVIVEGDQRDWHVAAILATAIGWMLLFFGVVMSTRLFAAYEAAWEAGEDLSSRTTPAAEPSEPVFLDELPPDEA